ncbi:hypothetical protein JOF56_002416 [Kibdelosporangium banguiense]|uniref:Predicted membrane protein YciQ-like C-terminal domain-containing protein n=1 Tax=Kibdelosporangium banguiense TaxID=1365924 RepID=A0ABS4TDW5_9PSEU|nr:DUF2207 domain-containing protein [Kibdelosporangium banguiense]MBP2322031.1 hypothetical protein [Kibdelosporangium banguiense]
MTAFQFSTACVVLLWFVLQAAMRHWTKGTPLPHGTPVDEPPAIVNMAVNGWQMTDDAITATVVDLAARGVLTFGPDPERVTILLPEVIPSGLRTYEQTLLQYLRSRAESGVVPAETLKDRPVDVYDQFEREVDTEADAHGRVSRRWSGRQRAVLIFASLPPAVLTVSLVNWTKAADVYYGRWILIGLLWWLLALFAVRGLDPRPTPPGAEMTARWLKYREFLRESPDIETARPADLALWGRQLAYAAALGLAEVTFWLIPAGRDEKTIAWSNHQGGWQKIKIWYPWMLGWGRSPGRRALHGVWKLVVGVVVLFIARPELFGVRPVPLAAIWTTGLPLTGALVALAAGVLDFCLLVTEALTRRTRTGLVLRQSTARHTGVYLALCDFPKSKAYIVRTHLVRGGSAALKQGTKVELTCGSGIGWVTRVRIL